METQFGLTPFGSQRMTHALLAAHQKTREVAQGATVDKWQLYRWLCEGKSIIGINDRTLAVLSALLSFHPEAVLSEAGGLVVFPSNKQLALRAHGMADATLRRHLAALVETGLISRQDSPNGKRYARRTKSGELKIAFGFSLAPLLARAQEIETTAEQVKEQKAALREIREQLTLLRRDIAKMLEYGLEEELPGPWVDLKARYRTIVDSIPRRAEYEELSALVEALRGIHISVGKLLNNQYKTEKMSGNESHIERQLNESEPDSYFDRNLAETDNSQQLSKPLPDAEHTISLDFVLRSCPELANYASGPIRHWQDLLETTEKIRGFIGIDTKLYENALKVLGSLNRAIVIACLLERYETIRSTSGYLHILTQKAAEGAFCAKALLISARHKQTRYAQNRSLQ